MPEIWETRPPLSSTISQGTADDAGTTQYQPAVDSESAGDVAFAGPIADFILYGVVNGAFAQGPPDSTQNIEPVNNPLPYWTGPVQVSGGAITASHVVDASSPSGYNLRFTINPGAAGDEAYFEQVVPVGGTRIRRFGGALRANAYRVLVSGGAPFLVTASQYLKADGTTTGTEKSTTTSLSADATLYQSSALTGSTTASPPADAFFLRVRIGVRRNTMAATDTGTIDITDVRADRAAGNVLIPENTAPGSYPPGNITQTGGTITMGPGGASAYPSVLLDQATPYAALSANSHTSVMMNATTKYIWLVVNDVSAAYVTDTYFQVDAVPLQIGEQAAPGTPDSGYYSIYPKTDGILYGKNDGGTEIEFAGVTNGTFTPAFAWATPGTSTWTHTTQEGTYTKVDDCVHFSITITLSALTKGTGAGNLRITGLPFTVAQSAGVSALFAGYTKAGYTMVSLMPIVGQTYCEINTTGSGNAEATFAIGDTYTGAQVKFRCTGHYYV